MKLILLKEFIILSQIPCFQLYILYMNKEKYEIKWNYSLFPDGGEQLRSIK